MKQGRYIAIIADDHAIVRGGLRAALEKPGLIEPEGIEVVGEASNGVEAIAQVKQHRPDLLVLDVSMPLIGGVEVLVETRRWSPETKVVALTGVSSIGLVSNLVDSGVDGLFSKASSNDELYEKLPGILRGRRFIAQSFMRILEESPRPAILTDRERQTLNMVLSGRSNKEIADGLGISIKTVDKHRTSLMQKLKVRSLPQLMALALKEGMVDPSVEL